jgi:hypothetical protein
MQLHLSKPWRPLDDANVRRLTGQLGVYELADRQGRVVYIGYAGGRELFGLRSALQRQLGRAVQFRYEVNMQYQSRWRELLMLHERDHGSLPELNANDRPARLGSMR